MFSNGKGDGGDNSTAATHLGGAPGCLVCPRCIQELERAHMHPPQPPSICLLPLLPDSSTQTVDPAVPAAVAAWLPSQPSLYLDA
jgi:hypothetical protein